MAIKKIFFLLSICFLIFNAHSRLYTAVCTSDSKCNTNQMLVTYTSLTTQQSITACTDKDKYSGCSTVQAQYKVQLCADDSLGNQCTNGLCVLEQESTPSPTPQLESCAPQQYISYDSECPSIVLSQPPQTITCADCKQSTCTGNVKCITTTSPQQEFCFTQTTCPMSSIKVKFGACTNGKDSFDISCKCCVIEQKQESTTETKICSLRNAMFQTKQFSDFYYAGDMVEEDDKNNNLKDGQNWEAKVVQIGILALSGLLFMGLGE